MPTKQFLKDRRRGEQAQDYIIGMFESWGLSVRPTPRGYHPGFDMAIEGNLHGNDIRQTVEVKYDEMSSKTGQIYLDINSLGRSKAGILTICTGKPIDTVYVLPLADALQFARANQNISGGEYREPACCIPKQDFMSALKPKVLTTK